MKQPHLSATCTICGATGYEANRPCPLHAAAPELLEALEEAEVYLEDGAHNTALEIIRAAILAAKGD